jgi:Xaa-Pro aminopeptidase
VLHAVYADITRVGIAAPQPTSRQKEIFNIVKRARDVATIMIKERYENQNPIQGWQVDQACRNFIQEVGFGDYFIHRTGHNIGEEVHGPGANLDNLETHDFRQLLPGTAFSIEPGIYLPQEFGVRLEYDIYLDPVGQIRITGGIQEELVCLNV